MLTFILKRLRRNSSPDINILVALWEQLKVELVDCVRHIEELLGLCYGDQQKLPFPLPTLEALFTRVWSKKIVDNA